MFKETYGTTVNNYLISKRITRVKQLLRFTDMTVDEVGVAVGMGDANYLVGCSED
ncbi:helix-turn-helix domain-containing protein [Holdemanella biformis]|uniref:helix-turn-helix domain-containing protein n=1 Tax=Holdemanella biformis TaxID=1735 RepID=UPI001C38D013|nr:helix-turn-helix domain-containing protein [Holdemanella biformis]MBV4150428.1 helix-turn-helix domain-containing protein [Holdemanella biformis]